ncbi:MAG: glycerol-3-phosphate acyltransferase [Dehalococcoidales bacterium]
MQNLWLILIAGIAYIIGSIPTAFLITRQAGGELVWLKGSGNVGAMNVYRTTGSIKLMVLATALDVGKGALVVFIVQWLYYLGYDPGFALMTGVFFVVMGHNYSLFLRFRGGRGLASFLGVLLAVNPYIVPACLGVMLAAILATEYGTKGRIEGGFRKVFHALGAQILGRVIGLSFCLIPMYFLAPGAFLYLLPGIGLALPKNISRLRGYLQKSKEDADRTGNATKQ